MVRRALAVLLSLLLFAAPAQAGWLYAPSSTLTSLSNTWTELQTFTVNPIITNTAPGLVFTDTTASAKSLTIAVDANLAQLRESAGASGSLLVLDLANNNVGIGTTGSDYKLHVRATDNKGIKSETTGTDRAELYLSKNSGAVRNWIMSVAGATNGHSVPDQSFYIADVTGSAARLTINTIGNVGIGTTSPASLLDLRAGDLTQSGANGQKYVMGRATQLVAVGSGLTTKATTIQIPADAVVYAVPVRVKTIPGGTATMTVTATTSGTAFQKGASISTATGTTDVGNKNTPVNYNSVAAQTITFTFDAPTTDALGEIRVDIYYHVPTAPTS